MPGDAVTTDLLTSASLPEAPPAIPLKSSTIQSAILPETPSRLSAISPKIPASRSAIPPAIPSTLSAIPSAVVIPAADIVSSAASAVPVTSAGMTSVTGRRYTSQEGSQISLLSIYYNLS